MKKLLCLLIVACFLMQGCGYVSHTIAKAKAKQVRAIAGAVPVDTEKPDIIIERWMVWYVGQNPTIQIPFDKNGMKVLNDKPE